MSIGVLAAHFAVLAIWAACAAIAAGVGFLLLRFLLPPHGTGESRVFAAVWVGLAGIVLFLQTWHFAFPIDGRTLAIVVTAGLAGLAPSARHGVSRLIRFRLDKHRALALLFFLGFAGWIADQSLRVFAAHDSEVYMVPGLEWAKAWPVVPGLGALHGHLAFNNATVLLAALLEAGPWPPAAPHLLAGFFLAIVAARIAGRLASPGRDAITAPFDILLLAPLVAMALDNQLVPSLSADVGVAVASFAAASLLLDRLAADPGEPPRPCAPLGAAAALGLGITLKLSAAPFAVAGGALAIALLVRDAKAGALRVRAFVAVAALGLALVGTWVTRGVVLSGYPLYPSTFLPAPVEWRVPVEQAQAEAGWITHFARTWYDRTIANADLVAEYSWARFRWFRPWLEAQAAGVDFGMVLMPLVIAILSGLALQLRANPGTGPPVRTLLIAGMAALLFWFATAPRPDMGLGPAWVLASMTAAQLFARLRGRAGMHAAFACSLALAAVVAGNAVRLTEPDPGTKAWRAALFSWADPHDWFQEPAPPALLEYRTGSGLVLMVPAQSNLCRRAPLTCTPYPSSNLRLRRPGDLGGGFVIDGAWKAERWPNRSSRFLPAWRESRRP